MPPYRPPALLDMVVNQQAWERDPLISYIFLTNSAKIIIIFFAYYNDRKFVPHNSTTRQYNPLVCALEWRDCLAFIFI